MTNVCISLYLQLLDQLHSMCDFIESEFEYVGLPADSKLYGRDEEMKKLRSFLDFDKDVDTCCKILFWITNWVKKTNNVFFVLYFLQGKSASPNAFRHVSSAISGTLMNC